MRTDTFRAPNRRTTLRALAAATLLAACGSPPKQAPAPAYPPLEVAELGSMRNVSTSAGLWLGGQPTAKDMDLARRRGVERVIALGSAREVPFDLPGTCRSLGLECHLLGLPPGEPPPDAAVDRVLALLAEEPRRDTLLFCEDGSRSAALVAVHRVVNVGLSVEDALAEARRAGVRTVQAEEFVREQVARLSSPVGE